MREQPSEQGESARVAVLGPVAVRNRAGEFVEPAGHRAKGLIVALALAAPRSLGADRLTEEVWGDDPPRGARAALQTLVSRIRSSLGDELIESTPSGYRLADASTVDLRAAERQLDESRVALADERWTDAITIAGSAIALWRGEPGADLDTDVMATVLVERAARILDGLETVLATASLALDLAVDAEDLARRLCQRAPFDDNAHLLLMRALDALGRSTEAVSVYATFRERVQDAFGTSPALELQSLNLELLDRADSTPSVSAVAAVPSAQAVAGRSDPSAIADTDVTSRAIPAGPAFPVANPATNTPAPAHIPRRTAVSRGIRAAPNALIGRDRAVAEIEALVASARVTTILGPGGLGKTRVAHEVAAHSLSSFGAVMVVELASVRSEDDVVFGLASSLGIREVATTKRIGDQVVRADLRSRIVARLGDVATLLVLDNCEHVIDAAAEWSASLTAELPALSILATSRTPLAISSERVFALAPLGGVDPDDPGDSTRLPNDPADDPAVQLFVDRATAARPGAVLPLEAVARLCARLDGLPLAIELAAARIRSMPLDEIERRLSNRFALLTGGDRSAPERHRTLLAVIEWSWNLLATDEQRALSRLSEFADGFSAEAAGLVAGEPEEITDLLDALVAQSLVMMRETESGVRYRMLETVREFGQLQLDRSGTRIDVRDALFAWADRFAIGLSARTDGSEQVATFTKITVEQDNLIDVLRRAIDAERPDIVVSVFGLLGYYWSLRSAHSEVIAFSKPVFESVRAYDPPPSRVEATAATLLLLSATSMFVELRFAVRPLSRLRALTTAHPIENHRLAAMAGLMLSAKSAEATIASLETMIASGDPQTVLIASLVGSMAAENDGRRDDAIALARRAARLAGTLHDTWGEAMAGQMLGQLHSQSAEPVEALHWARRARSGLERLGAFEDIRQLDWIIATNDVAVGDFDEAAELFDRLIDSPGQFDGIEVASIGRSGRAEILRAQGRLVEAKQAQLEALATFDIPHTRASPWFRIMVSSALTTLVVDGTGTAAEKTGLARRLRSRTIASLRAQPGYVDRPVLGASIIGLAVWLEDEGRTSAFPDFDAEIALGLLALAEVMGARQDPPALHLAPVFDRFTRTFSSEAVAAARASAAATPPTERPERVAALLRTPGPWSWVPQR